MKGRENVKVRTLEARYKCKYENKKQIVDSCEATLHSICSKCFPSVLTYALRRTRH